MSQGRLRNFLRKVSHYFMGNGLAVLSGVISYPILTRALGPELYGLMGLVSSVLLAAVAVGKLGVQNSIVRFHAEARKAGRLGHLTSTYVSFGFLSGLLGACLMALGSAGLGALGLIDSVLMGLLLLTAPLVMVRTEHLFGMSLIRADERTRAYNLIDVFVRYLSLGLALFFVFNLVGGVEGFYTGILCAEIAGLCVVLWYVRRVTGFELGKPDKAVLKEAINFGLPLLAFELTNILLAFGDRVLIKTMLDEGALGHYTAAYNLGNTLQSFMLLPVALAIQPMYTRIWAEEGPEATSKFLGRAGSLFFLLVIPAIGGVVAVREPLMLLLAGEAYLQGVDVLPLTFAGFVLYGGYAVMAAGLFLHKQTVKMSVAVGMACAVNLGLNVLLIPPMGIMGAALATLISYVGVIIALTSMAFRYLRFDIPWGYILRVCLMSGVMVGAIFWIDLGEAWATLLVRVVVGVVVMAVLAVGVDGEGRALLKEVVGSSLSGRAGD